MTPDSSTLTAELQRPANDELQPITVAFADYDRTRPLSEGRVKADGLALTTDPHANIGDFCKTPVYEEYDVAEMSFSWYVTARGQGEPVIALPIFLLRMPVLAFIYVRSDSPYTHPKDLIGKRVGSHGYRQTVNLWLRGVLNEFYGLAPEDLTWVNSDEVEGAGFTVPSHIRREILPNSTTIKNLKSSVVDAMFCTTTPQPFLDGEPWIRRLFPDAQEESHLHAAKIGGAPITHVLVMNKNLADQKPWIAASLTKAFVDAQREADALCNVNPKLLSQPDSVFFLPQQHAAYGNPPYSNGLEPNRKILEDFVRYAHEQGYIDRPMQVDEFFVPVPTF